MIRIDKTTGKKYSQENVPLDRDRAVRCITKNGTEYNIKSMDTVFNREDAWCGDRFIGDYYAVFMQAPGGKFSQQVSPWYFRYGNAERKLNEIFKTGGESLYFSGKVRG